MNGLNERSLLSSTHVRALKMARSLRSKRLQRNRSVRRQKFYEREKQKLWELAKKVSEREEAETAKEEAGTRAGTVLDDGEYLTACIPRVSAPIHS